MAAFCPEGGEWFGPVHSRKLPRRTQGPNLMNSKTFCQCARQIFCNIYGASTCFTSFINFSYSHQTSVLGGPSISVCCALGPPCQRCQVLFRLLLYPETPSYKILPVLSLGSSTDSHFFLKLSKIESPAALLLWGWLIPRTKHNESKMILCLIAL